MTDSQGMYMCVNTVTLVKINISEIYATYKHITNLGGVSFQKLAACTHHSLCNILHAHIE